MTSTNLCISASVVVSLARCGDSAQKDIAPQLLTYLDDPSENLRESATAALGVLESPQAEEALAQRLERMKALQGPMIPGTEQWIRTHSIPTMTLQLALGHIRSRDLHGTQKLDCIAQEIGLTYEGIVRLAQILDTRLHYSTNLIRSDAGHSPAYNLVHHFVSVVHTMGEQGEDITPLRAERIAISPVAKLRIQGASLSRAAEASLFLDCSNKASGVFGPEYFIHLGPEANTLLFAHLEDMVTHPDKYDKGPKAQDYLGTRSLLEAAARSRDPRAAPVIAKLVQSPNPRIQEFAQRAQGDMKRDEPIIDFSAWW